jgi:hypothetical protein
MSWIAVAVAGSAIVGGIASENAASSQEAAANNATQAQLQMFQQTQQNEQPFIQGGQQTFQQLLQATQPGGQFNQPFNYQQSPGYQFALGQGLGTLVDNGAATGQGGGNTLKCLVNYATGAANQDYNSQLQNWLATNQQQYNMQSNLAGLGQNAAGNLGNTSAQVGNTIGSNMIGAGNAAAAGTVGVANALSGGVGTGYNAYLQQQMLAALQNPGGGTGMDQFAAQSYPSDRRLKSNIKRIGTHPLGIGIYSYTIFGRPDIGVMADELEKVLPAAVGEFPNGYKFVHYGML